MGATSNLNLTQFPVVNGGSSLLGLACTETTATALANTRIIYEDYPAALWHFGSGRFAKLASTTTNSITTAACPSAVNTCAHFTSADVNHGVSGPGIPPRAFIKSVTSATTAVLNISGVAAASMATPGFTQPPPGGTVVVAAGPIPKWSCTVIVIICWPPIIIIIVAGVAKGDYKVISTGTGTSTLENLGSEAGVAPGTAIAAGTAIPSHNKSLVVIENSDGRSFTDGSTSATAACSATGNFRADDVGRYVSGGTTAYSLAPFSKITAVGGASTNGCGAAETSAVLAPAPGAHAGSTATFTVSAAGYPCNPLPALNTTVCGTAPNGSTVQKINGVVPAFPQATYTTTTRYIKDATYTVGPPDKVCSATARFGPSDINTPIFNISSPGFPGAGKIPVNDWITAVSTVGATTCATLNAALVGVSSNANVAIGQPNAGAPANGDSVVSAGVELSLNPSLVSGQPACSTNTLSGFNIDGLWNNPGYTGIGAGVFSDASLDQPVLGQFAFPTAVLTFNAYLMQVPATAAATATRHQLLPHYEVIYPLVPTGAAICPPPSTLGEASVFHFSGFSPSEGATVSGVGTPGSVAIRGLMDRNTANGAAPPAAGIPSTRAYYSTTGAAPNPAWSTNQHCYQPVVPVFGFYCGQG